MGNRSWPTCCSPTSLRAGSQELASRPTACTRALWAPICSIKSEVWQERSCACSLHLCELPKKAPTPSSGWPPRPRSKESPENISSTGKSRQPIRNHMIRRSRRGCGKSADICVARFSIIKHSYAPLWSGNCDTISRKKRKEELQHETDTEETNYERIRDDHPSSRRLEHY